LGGRGGVRGSSAVPHENPSQGARHLASFEVGDPTPNWGRAGWRGVKMVPFESVLLVSY